MDNEAIIRYKFYLCRKFLDKLFVDNIITKTQKAKLENVIARRLADV